jgi:uncharacterized protein
MIKPRKHICSLESGECVLKEAIDNMSEQRPSSDIAFTPAVKAIQAAQGSRQSYARMESRGGWQNTVTTELTSFIAELDMFYLGTANSAGQPYIQYRGGPKGLLKVIDNRTLGFADFGGNRQFISVGNLSENSKAFLFLMDYANQQRIKVWGAAEVVEGDADLLERLQDSTYGGRVERAILFRIEAWDVNCPQHIHRRFPEAVVEQAIASLESQVAELKEEIARLKHGFEGRDGLLQDYAQSPSVF